MIKSMTGYSKAVGQTGGKIFSVEVKSLNSKQADIYLRIPHLIKAREFEIRTLINNSAKRGKIDCIIGLEYLNGEQAAKINKPVVKDYYYQLQDIAGELDMPAGESLMQTILRMPDALSAGKDELPEEEWVVLQQALLQSLEQLDSHRVNEGRALKEDILKHTALIEGYLQQIAAFESGRLTRIKERIRNNLSELFPADAYDRNRFEQELIYYLEKFDISEEKVRLQNHCNYFRQVIDQEEQPGKKLGFLCQEMGREINTIGSKASDFEIQRLVVLMKDELEKIKEQLMNIL